MTGGDAAGAVARPLGQASSSDAGASASVASDLSASAASPFGSSAHSSASETDEPTGAVAPASDERALRAGRGQASASTRPPAPRAPVVTSLAHAQFDAGRPEAPESTIGGQATCIVCFTGPKSHIAVPCGHQCACGECSAQMKECPVCRIPLLPAQMWMRVRVA